MSLVMRELSLFLKDVKRKINLSAEANANRTDPVYVRVDEKRINENYKRIIPLPFRWYSSKSAARFTT